MIRAPALAAVLFVAVSCGGAEAVEPATVRMLDNRFDPIDITVEVGQSVTFVGAGRNPHNAVASDGSWSTETVFGSLEQFDGEEAALTFDAPGVYPYFCTLHGNAEGAGMAGTLTVMEASAP